MTPGIPVQYNGETWTTTGETRPDYDQTLIRLQAPTNMGGTRYVWVSEDDYLYLTGF